MPLHLKKISLAISLASATLCAQAQIQTLKDAAQKAILTNPEVQAKWHSFQSTSSGRDAVFGGYLPNVSLTADTGRDNRDNRLGKSELSRTSTAISLNQMIYDGFLTPPVEIVSLARGGYVILCCERSTIYEDDDRPVGAPAAKEVTSWEITKDAIIPDPT